MHVHLNAVITVTILIGYLPVFYYPICYNPDGITNIISMNPVSKHFSVTCDSE